MERTIVKVHLLAADPERAIVHDEKRRYVLEVPASRPLRARMGEAQFCYFVADIGGAAVDLLDLAHGHEW